MSKWYEQHSGRNHRPFAAILNRCAWFLVAGCFVVAASSGVASEIDFLDEFSYADGTMLNGSNGWGKAGSGTAMATNGTAELINVAFTNLRQGHSRRAGIANRARPGLLAQIGNHQRPAD